MVPSRQCRGNTCVKLNHCTLRTRACARCVRGAVRCSAGAVHLAHDGARHEEEHQADVRDVGRRVGRQADQGAAVVLGGKGSRRRARGVAGGSLRHLSWSPRLGRGRFKCGQVAALVRTGFTSTLLYKPCSASIPHSSGGLRAGE